MRHGKEVDPAAGALIELGAAVRPRAGESVSGDAYWVKRLNGSTLLAVVDGVGHGPHAALAARTALAVVEARATSSLPQIARRCHDALRPTRGAVMTLASIDGRLGTLTWLGIGNVSAVLVRGDGPATREVLVSRVGLLGDQMPRLAAVTLFVSPGDVLVVATDGVRWDPHAGPIFLDTAERMARELLRKHASPTDDALVVVARVGDGAAT